MAGVVVLGVTRSGNSGSAMRWACSAAALRGYSLALVHAWDEPLKVSVELPPGTLPDVLCPSLSCAAQGPAAEVLLAHEPDLLVLGGRLGAHRMRGVTRFCLRHAPCPVIVVADVERTVTGRVVVGVNGSAASLIALAWAAREARLQGAELVVVHAWQLHPTSAHQLMRPALAAHVQEGTALAQLQGWIHTELGAVRAELHALHGGPLDGLLELSANADLLVLGRSSPTGIARLLHGGLSADLSSLAACPVAVIPTLERSSSGQV